MNFLDAHKIIHAYIDVMANRQGSKTPVRRVSELKNSKKDIFDAYKIFVAHMLAFDTRTQEEYELLNSLIVTLNLFVDDRIVDEFEACQKILDDKSFFGRLKNKTAIPFAEEKRDNLLKEIAPIISELYCSEEMDNFTEEIFAEAKSYRENISTLPKGTRESLVKRLTTINNYCYRVYEIAKIQMVETDVEYFYPFPLLWEFSKNPNLTDLYAPYRQYIFLNN